jgi:hypothetical protein
MTKKEIYPDDKADETWTKDGVKFYLINQPFGHWCGYCRFEKRPVIEQGYDGLLTYVPVHGGITYAIEDEDGSMVYGFDCAHAGDKEDSKYSDETWLRLECERMAIAIMATVDFEKDYLHAKSNEDKANIIDAYHEKVSEACDIDFDIQDNFGSMIRAMMGSL